MQQKTINKLLSVAEYSIDPNNDKIYVVDFSALKLATIGIEAESVAKAKEGAAKWFEDEINQRLASQWVDAQKA